MKSGSQDNVFNPDRTGLKSPDRPAQQLPKEDSASSGPVTPSTAGADSTLTFSLPLSMKSGSQDNVFNPDRTGLKSPDRPAQQLPKEDSATAEKTGLEDSFYEDCGPEPARYIPGERYVDVKHNNDDNILEGLSTNF